ncbi:restriction endonuclease subunit S [Vibrio vulnificus]|nr:restriction endonuclease subunit S [Vibrio vulnificus]
MSLDQTPINQLITDNIDTWTSTVKTKATTGRGSSKKLELYGVKKLRELILELAVRGKLVPQDSNDEPVSTLLERNFDEQARLIKTESLKTKANKDFSDGDEYLAAPVSWGRVKLGNLAKFIDYRGKTPKKIDSGVRLITAKNVKFGHISLFPEEFISEEEYVSWMTRGFPRAGDILFTPEAPLGNVAQVDLEEKFALAQRAICFQLHIPEISDFLKLFLMAPSFQNLLLEKATGTTAKGIKASVLKELLVYLPSLYEQHRIVAKVDELMALCDQLEQQTEASIAAHQVLVTTLLDTLTNSANAEELMQNWQMVAEHFDTLFTTEESIDQLKQTILQLAVMGKLVPQDPNDEPAAKLLERIAEEKAQLIKDKKIKKQKALPPITDDEKPFEVPSGWEWSRFEDVVEIHSGITKGRKLVGRELKTIPYLSVANVQRGYLNLQNVKEIDLPVDEMEKYSVEEGDLLITEGGDWDKVGRTAIWRSEVPYMAHQNHVFKARPYLIEQSETWLEMYLNGPFARNYFAGSSKQTTNLASINKTQLRSCLIAVPPHGEKQKITTRVEELFHQCDLLQQHIIECKATQVQLADTLIEQAL